MNDKRREQALAVYCEHNTGNANANYYEMRDSAVASMLAFARDQMAEKDAEIARLRRGHEMKIELTPAVIECLKRGLNCWPQQNFADGAEIRKILEKAEEVKLRIGEDV